MTDRFDPAALHDEMDDLRRARGMTWEDVSREVGVSASTIAGVAKRDRLETDGVLAMTRWLGRSVESFIPGYVDPPAAVVTGDDRANSGRFRRFDTKALFAALDAERRRREVTWKQVATELSVVQPVSPSMLTRLKHGGRIELYAMLAMVGWLDERVDTFTRLTSV